MTKKEWLRQFISSFIDGQNVDAMLSSLADEAERQEQLSIAVNDSLTISTSVGIYLDKNLAQVGITRPPELGMDDLAFRNMGIQINAAKQITEVLHTVLETFFGDETVRGWTQCTQPAPYTLEDGDDLLVELDDGTVFEIPFQDTDFINISAAKANEVADVITRYLRSQNLTAFATSVQDVETGNTYVRIFGGAKGPFSMVRVQGGRVQNQLEFPTVRGTDLGVNTTNWMITRTIGSTIRIRWYSGPQPALEKVFPGDKVMIYGDAFEAIGIFGTHEVKNVRPGTGAPAYDAGYFEIDLPTYGELKSSQPDIAPPPNTPGNTYSFVVAQAFYDDLKFFLPRKAVPYSLQRYALAWEPRNNLLKIYLPATTKVVRRDLIGAAHTHLLYGSQNFTAAFGSVTPGDDENKVEIISDRIIRFRQAGYDNLGSGGILSYSNPLLVQVPIDYVYRENEYTYVVCTEPHGLPTKIWDQNTDYLPGDDVLWLGHFYESTNPSGPLSVGPRQPDDQPGFWEIGDPGKDLCDIVVSVAPALVPQDDPENPFLGSYVVDPGVKYALRSEFVTSREPIRGGERISTLFCKGILPNSQGILWFDLNTDKEEGPVRYYGAQTSNAPNVADISTISQVGTTLTVTTVTPHGAIPGSTVVITGVIPASLNGTFVVDSVSSPTTYIATNPSPQVASAVGVGQSATQVDGAACTLIMDPSYSFKFDHAIGTDVTLLSDRKAYTPTPDGSDYGFYVTDTASGRVFAANLMQQITALGIKLEIIVVYPSDVGLGNEGESTLDGASPQSEATYVWGPTG